MDKLLLTLTLLALSSGVLCNGAENLPEESPTAVETQLNNTVYKLLKKCAPDNLRDDYVVIRGMGAYKLHQRPPKTWNAARKACMEEGAQLAVINSNAEAAMLMDWSIRENVRDGLWIGTHDLFELGDWVTLTGETLQAAGYDHWAPGQPDNWGGTEHCGSLLKDTGMNDATCNGMQPYFCKITLC